VIPRGIGRELKIIEGGRLYWGEKKKRSPERKPFVFHVPWL
jgi:hypothetical protein